MKQNINLALFNNSHNLTKLDQKVLDCLKILVKNQKIFEYTLQRIAQDINVSNSKITKTLKKCGYSGWKEFRSMISINALASESETTYSDYFKKTLFPSMVQTFNNIDKYDVDHFSKLVMEKNKIYFLAGGANIYLCNDVSEKFNKIGIAARPIEISKPQSNTIDDDCLIVAISISGLNYHMKNRIQYLKESKKNVKIVSITLAEKSNIYDLVDKEFNIKLIDNVDINEREIPRHSRLIILALLDTLFLDIYTRNPDKYLKIIEKNKSLVRY